MQGRHGLPGGNLTDPLCQLRIRVIVREAAHGVSPSLRIICIFFLTQRIINKIDTKAKCRHLKKLTCKEALRQVFNRVYRLEIQPVMLVFSSQLCELLPL
jgi:hypothetical protein